MSDLTLAELVEQLAVRTFDGHGHNGDPLLTQLMDARYSSAGRSSGTSTASREKNPFDLGAHMLLEDIWGRIQAMTLDWTDGAAAGSPQLDLLAWYASFTAADARGEVEPHHHLAATTWLTEWVARITTHLTPPDTRPLRGYACPLCGATRYDAGEGDLATGNPALQVTVTDGQDLHAECLNCHTHWIGNTAIVSLAKEIGLELDPARIRDALTRQPAPAAPRHAVA